MSVEVCVGGRGNYLGKVLGFRQILDHQILDPKGGAMEFMSCFIPIMSYMYFRMVMPNCNSSTVCSLSSPLPLSSAPLFCLPLLVIGLPAPLTARGVGSAVPRELFAFPFSSRLSLLSYAECGASLFKDSYPILPNTSPKYLDTTVLKYHKPPLPQNPRAWDSFLS